MCDNSCSYKMGLNIFTHISFSMKLDIIELINHDRFYANISDNLQEEIKSKIKYTKKKDITLNSEISRSTLQRILTLKNYWINIKTLFILSKNLGISHEYVKINIKRIKTKDSFPISTKFITIDCELARITGHLLCDGGIHIKKNEGKLRIFYVNNDSGLLNSFSNDIKSIFTDAKLYYRKREDRGDEIWLPTTIGGILFNLFSMYNCKLRRVPKFIFSLENHKKYAFLQAVFDDEGSISVEKRGIILSVHNKKLLNDFKNILQDVGINSAPIRFIEPKNRSSMYRFGVYGKENIIKFNKLIGSSHSIKSKKLKLLVAKYGD